MEKTPYTLAGRMAGGARLARENWELSGSSGVTPAVLWHLHIVGSKSRAIDAAPQCEIWAYPNGMKLAIIRCIKGV